MGAYSGYVYAMETLFQMLDRGDSLPQGVVKDGPAYPYRGVMIDTVRHYISVATIKKLIKTMPLVKLNILHWHLFDDEAFPFESFSNPELIQGAYSKNETYSREDIQEVIEFAELNAVSVVPEVESPGHVRSWGQNSVWKSKNIVVTCGRGYSAQVDVSK